jgi:CRISPR-associated protein Csb2
MKYANYLRLGDSFARVPGGGRAQAGHPLNGVVYGLHSKVLPLVTATVEIAERTRKKLMGIHAQLSGDPARVSPRFSGKDAQGRPLAGHRHVYILPFDGDGDGRLDHMAVVCRDLLDYLEAAALDRLEWLRQPDGRPNIRCIPLQWGKLTELFAPAARVASVTPFIPARHWRRGRGDFATWLKREVARECGHHNLPPPRSIGPVGRARTKRGLEFLWLEFRRNRKDDPIRLGYGFEIEFAEPVQGPVALGYGAHFGLGQFRPAE